MDKPPIECIAKIPKHWTPEEKAQYTSPEETARRNEVAEAFKRAFEIAREHNYRILNCLSEGYFFLEPGPSREIVHTGRVDHEEQYGFITQMNNGEQITIFKPWPAKKL